MSCEKVGIGERIRVDLEELLQVQRSSTRVPPLAGISESLSGRASYRSSTLKLEISRRLLQLA